MRLTSLWLSTIFRKSSITSSFSVTFPPVAMAVSYTHLDVYKRQVLARPGSSRASPLSGTLFQLRTLHSSLGSLSMHSRPHQRDVYKRQLMGDMPTNKARMSDNAQKQSASNAVPIFYSVLLFCFVFFVKQFIILMKQIFIFGTDVYKRQTQHSLKDVIC